ncbi:MAG TPA: TetR/AcrR family transcriptional regulator [Acidimicrobiales bacterium]|nr:TetR/AcrR family transcriptional regulator [Acidimicrobiales bacterium]
MFQEVEIESSDEQKSPRQQTVPRRRGRPRLSEGPAVTREEIVREALVSLTGSGVAGLVLRDVARRLSVSLPTIQRHFATKDDLWRACVGSLIDDAPIRTDIDADEVSNLDEQVTLYLQHLVRRTALYPYATAAMWNDTGPGSEERLAYLVERTAPLVELARNRFSVAKALGVFREIDQDVFFALIVLGVSSLGCSKFPLQRLFGIDIEDEAVRDGFSNALADILLNGLRSRET